MIRTICRWSGVGLLGACLLATGCMVAPVIPPLGAAYADVSAPLDLSNGGPDGKTIGEREGEAQSQAIFGLVAWGDASLQAAARNGHLKRVHHTDYRFQNYFFGAYSVYTTIARGE